jgi:hypothetical protein
MSFVPAGYRYYPIDQEINLTIYPEKIAISAITQALHLLKAWLEKDSIVKHPLEIDDLRKDGIIMVELIDGATEEEILELLDRLNQTGLIRFSTPMFVEPSARIILTDEIVVKFKDTVSVDDIEAFINSQGARILQRNFLWPNCYILGFTAGGGANALDVSRTFFESGMVEYAHPNFVILMKHLSDANNWITLLEEDFEGDFPKPNCAVYDRDPLDCGYFWGPVDMEENQVGWVAGSHNPSCPDLRPDVNNPDAEYNSESYAKNMDSWLVYGPFDFSGTYWARLSFSLWSKAPKTEPLEPLVSIIPNFWNGPKIYGGFSSGPERQISYLNTFPGVFDVAGIEFVWIAFRFKSDDTFTQKSGQIPYYGYYLDDIKLEASSLEPAPMLTEDPWSDRQWALNNVGQSAGEPGVDINILSAWDIRANTPGVPSIPESITVAVIDEGVDLNHRDLNLVEGYDATGQGSEGGANPWDAHGTACGGIIGAKKNNMGIVGVAPDVKIMPVRIAYSPEPDARYWVTTDAQIAHGILWAATHGARVLSNSYGGGRQSGIMDRALKTARDMGCTIVFAAGNNNDPGISYPGSSDKVIAVGALDPCGERKNPDGCDGEPWGSNYSSLLDIMAPGVLIPTTDISGQDGYAPGDYFMCFNGTSSACPHVAGVAALMLIINPNLTPKEVQDIIQNTAVDLGDEGFDSETGWGLVDAHKAVLYATYATQQDLRILEWSAPAHAYQGQEIEVSFRVEYEGIVATDPFQIEIYLLRDNVIGPWDDPLTAITTTLEPSDTYEATLSLTIPSYVLSAYLLILSVDATNKVPEFDEENNLAFHTIHISDPAYLTVKPSPLDFGNVQVGSSVARSVYIQNEGSYTLTISSISYDGDPEFEVIPRPTPTYQINPWEYTDIYVEFSPQDVGTYSGIITIISDDPYRPEVEVPVQGVAAEEVPSLSAAPSLLFLDETTTEGSFAITNGGTGTLNWSIADNLPDWLSVSLMSGESASGQSVSVTVNISTEGLNPGTYVHDISISSNGGNGGVLVVMTIA